jgi:hypothetical protein
MEAHMKRQDTDVSSAILGRVQKGVESKTRKSVEKSGVLAHADELMYGPIS